MHVGSLTYQNTSEYSHSVMYTGGTVAFEKLFFVLCNFFTDSFFCFFVSRSTGRSHSVVQAVHSPPSSFLLTRATFVMSTVKTSRIESSLTARIALTMGTRRTEERRVVKECLCMRNARG